MRAAVEGDDGTAIHNRTGRIERKGVSAILQWIGISFDGIYIPGSMVYFVLWIQQYMIEYSRSTSCVYEVYEVDLTKIGSKRMLIRNSI
jgi:hypothetical protein